MAESLVPATAPMNPMEAPQSTKMPSHSAWFWGSFSALCILAFICALDVAIVTTALPSIVSAVGGATQYVWIANSFVLASSVLQPLFGQLADIFGRQTPLIASTTLFLVGSGIAGGAINAAMLIAGRVIQGIGAGGLYVLTDIVCCDLVPLRERGKYVGIMNAFAGFAAALGPVFGGLIAQADWRWVFYMNIPICGVALAAILLFMRLKTGAHSTLDTKSKLRRIDYIGNIIFIPSMVAILFGLISGNISYPWVSWHILLPIILGAAGWAVFHIQQAFTSHASIPGRLFTNRTSSTAFALTFISSALVQAIAYFLPVYFQGVKATSVSDSGVYFLPFAIATLVFAVLGGVLLSKFGMYRPLHAASFAVSAVGFGLFTLLDTDTPKVAWVFFQLIASAGAGFSQSTLLPAIMAALPESSVATATAAYAFVKTFGYIWGVAIPSIVFNAVFNANLPLISSEDLRLQLRDGAAYAYASEMHQVELPRGLQDQVIEVYTRSLRMIWWVGLGVSVGGFLLVWLQRELELRTDLVTKYGLDELPQAEKADANAIHQGDKSAASASESA
ncbi:MFS general substrate transporter [Whalleya microplaca]|nr:MFS general substrate transporter [Whalleya microplaca]